MAKMKRMFILLFVLLLLNGCRGMEIGNHPDPDKNALESIEDIDEDEDEVTDKIQVLRNWMDANHILRYANCIGKERADIFTGIMEYIWLSDEEEYYMDRDSEVYYYFSEGIWESGSKCNQIVFGNLLTDSFIRVIADTVSVNPVEMESININLENINSKYYYVIDLDGLAELFLRTDREGEVLFGNIVISSERSAEISDELPDSTFEVRDNIMETERFQVLKKYSQYLGVDQETVMEQITGSFVIDRYGYDKYEERSTAVLFSLDTYGCSQMLIPVELIFPDHQVAVKMSEMREFWTEPFIWFVYEGYSYYYDLGEFVIYVQSDSQGNVPIDGYFNMKF